MELSAFERLWGIIIRLAATGQCMQCKVLCQLHFQRWFSLPASHNFGISVFGLLPLLGIALQWPTYISHKHQLHLFCKTSFSPMLACSEIHESSPEKLFLLETASSPSCCALLPLTSHSPLQLGKESSFPQKKKRIQLLFLCLGLPPVSTETKLFHRIYS